MRVSPEPALAMLGTMQQSWDTFCCRALQEKKRLRQAELEAMGQPSTSVNMGEFSYESSAFIVHHTSILRNKRLLLVYTCAMLLLWTTSPVNSTSLHACCAGCMLCTSMLHGIRHSKQCPLLMLMTWFTFHQKGADGPDKAAPVAAAQPARGSQEESEPVRGRGAV